jgi:hypothetical protein
VITFGQAITGSGTAVALLTTAGESTITITNAGTATIYLGGGTGTTTSNGFPVFSNGSVNIPSFTSSKGTTVYAISASGGSIPVAFMISNAQ